MKGGENSVGEKKKFFFDKPTDTWLLKNSRGAGPTSVQLHQGQSGPHTSMRALYQDSE